MAVPTGGVPPTAPARTSPLTLIAAGIRILAAVPLILLQVGLGSATGSGGGSAALVLGLSAAFLLGGGVIQGLQWFLRTWQMTSTELVIDEGVFTRHHRVVPYDRVQQVDLQRKLIDQLLGVATLRIDTAGEGGATSVTLGLLDLAAAEQMRAEVLARRSAAVRGSWTPPHPAEATGSAPPPQPAGGRPLHPPPFGPTPPDAPQGDAGPWHPGAVPGGWSGGSNIAGPGQPPAVPVLTLSPARIVVAAVTGLLPVVVTPLLVATWFAVLAIPARSGGAALRGGSLVAITVVAVFVVGFTALGRVINDWGWRLERVGDQLHLRAGLTTVRHLTMPLRRVQHVTVSDNPLRRALGLCSIAVSSAAGPGASQQATTRLVVPVLRTSDVAAVLAAGLGDGWDIPPLTPRPPAARARAVRRRILALAIPAATGAAIAVLSGASALAVLAALVVLVGIPWGLIAHRRAGWAETEHACVLAKGVVHHRIAIVPVAKVQSARCADNPFQRRSRLRSLHLDVAGDESPLTSGTWDDTVLDDLPDDVAIRLCRTLPRRSGGAIQVGPPT